jgi:hypothetical protein
MLFLEYFFKLQCSNFVLYDNYSCFEVKNNLHSHNVGVFHIV